MTPFKMRNLLTKYKKGLIYLFGSLFIVAVVAYYNALPRPLFDVPYSTVVTDYEGKLLGARISEDGQWRFPFSDTLSYKYTKCVIEFEDRYFNYHPGFNPVSMIKALKQNIKHKRIVSGGSTITMQTVRLMRRNKRTYAEKIIEVILATRLELSYSKKKILSMYAAHAPMGGNVVGIDAAAWRFFGHNSSDLSWAEAAVLAVLPNSPAIMHPGGDRRGLQKKRDKLLFKLKEKGILSPQDLELALAEALPDHPHALPQVAPHLVTHFKSNNNGEYVKSTIHKELQLQVEEIGSRYNREFSQNHINNLAALVVDLRTNETIAYMGNVHFYDQANAGQVDIIQSQRSTGSILKPFLFAAMLQEGVLLPHQLIPDVPVNINGFAPKNFSLSYDGAVHADEALARSLNIPAVVLLRKYGISKFHDLLKKGGLKGVSRSPDYYGLSLILGGAEASLWDISQMYAQMVKAVINPNDKQADVFVLTHDKTKVNSNKIQKSLFDPAAAWLTLEALSNVNRPEEMDFGFFPSVQKIAWKTGTSYGFRDAWSIGVTPGYLVAVWVGNAGGEGRPGLTGARTAARVMFDVFDLLPATSWFEPPYSHLTEEDVCQESGLLRGQFCPDEAVLKLLLPLKSKDAERCSYHQRIHLSEDQQYRVFEQCAGHRGLQTTTWFVLPPAWEWYYKQQHAAYRSLPPYSPECLEKGNSKVMQFIYPNSQASLKIPKQLDGSIGKIVFELAHRNSSAKIFWHLDKEYIGQTTHIHQMPLWAESGPHVITVTDQEGNTLHLSFSIL